MAYTHLSLCHIYNRLIFGNVFDLFSGRLLASHVQEKATENITKSSNAVNKNDDALTKQLLPDGKKPIWYYHNKGIRARKLNQV